MFEQFKHYYFGSTFMYSLIESSYYEVLEDSAIDDPLLEFECLINIGAKFKATDVYRLEFYTQIDLEFLGFEVDYITQFFSKYPQLSSVGGSKQRKIKTDKNINYTWRLYFYHYIKYKLLKHIQ